MKTGPRNSLSAPHQVHKVDSFQNCGGEGIFLATPVGYKKPKHGRGKVDKSHRVNVHQLVSILNSL